MNILVPDSWLKDYLVTNATPHDIKRCLSLCGPSVERIYKIKTDSVYEIEVTTNRVDCMSIYGIAREAAAILPRFGFKAKLNNYHFNHLQQLKKSRGLGIEIINDFKLCKRILAIKLTDVKLKPSPQWVQQRLELVGQRPLNNIIDITNYVMWDLGHPIHAFDYDKITTKKIIVRLAKKGEQLVTLDEKSHTLQGGEIIFDDGKGEIIDLPGIMGTKNTVVSENTKNVLLFIENSDPVKIRQASIGLNIRTQAAVINEKHPSSNTALNVLYKAIDMCIDVAHAQISSKLIDINEQKIHPKTIQVALDQVNRYLGDKLSAIEMKKILQALNFSIKYSNNIFSCSPPDYRRDDIEISQDIIEEIARIYGYHNIKSRLPDTEPPLSFIDPVLKWEEEIKIRLRDWGYTEVFTYSMLSEKLLDIFAIDKNKTVTIANPLSSEWVYMRPDLLPSILSCVSQNLNIRKDFKIFELSNIYKYRPNNLPEEKPTLMVAWTGENFRQAKGLALTILNIFGIDLDNEISNSNNSYLITHKSMQINTLGEIGLIKPELLQKMSIKTPVTIFSLDFSALVNQANFNKKYIPIPKFTPVIEELTFTLLKTNIFVGEIINEIYATSKYVARVELMATFKNNVSFKIYYQDNNKQLTDKDIIAFRQQIVTNVEQHFAVKLKGNI